MRKTLIALAATRADRPGDVGRIGGPGYAGTRDASNSRPSSRPIGIAAPAARLSSTGAGKNGTTIGASNVTHITATTTITATAITLPYYR